MKIIFISDTLDEPFEMDSGSNPEWDFSYDVKNRVDAILSVEKMKREKEKHGIFRH